MTWALCERTHGLIVRDIAAGTVATSTISFTLADGGLLEELEEVIAAGRRGDPDEVAALAAFLASDDAASVTGAT
jgi:NAD(P)-dependent dehydrogenase (short-subunit alcohol dehydrogenase family)